MRDDPEGHVGLDDAGSPVRVPFAPTPPHMRPFSGATPVGFGSGADRASAFAGQKLFRKRPGSAKLSPLVCTGLQG